VKEKEKNYIHKSLAEYALKYGGTEVDLNKVIECASIECLIKIEEDKSFYKFNLKETRKI
jgi:hypothetical protein